MLSFPAEAVELLLGWYDRYARDLPWRHTKDPYAIWVSEIMLQQTRAETVKPYFARFMNALPTLRHLAEADEEVLTKLWEGLGYYSRVRNLQKAAKIVMAEHGGVLPADYQKLLSLPGIGPYTAGAVASIAYDIPVPAVDGNVLRVVARLTGDIRDVLLDTTKKAIERSVAPHVPTPRAGDFNQSLIELGAVVCLPGKEAKCHDCPLQLLCCGYREGLVEGLPVRIPKVKRRVDYLTVLKLRVGDKIVLRRRSIGGLLGGLYELPHSSGHLSEDDVIHMLGKMGIKVESVTPLPPAKHIFTHIDWLMVGYECVLDPQTDCALLMGGILATETEMREKYTIPSAFGAYVK